MISPFLSVRLLIVRVSGCPRSSARRSDYPVAPRHPARFPASPTAPAVVRLWTARAAAYSPGMWASAWSRLMARQQLLLLSAVTVDGAVRGGDDPRRRPARAELPPAAELAVSVVGLRGLGDAPAVPARHRGGRRRRVGGADGRRDGLPADLASGLLRAVLGRAGSGQGRDARGRRHRQGGAAHRLARHPSRHHGLRHPAVGGPGRDHRQRRPAAAAPTSPRSRSAPGAPSTPGRRRRTAGSPRSGCGSPGTCTTPSATTSR